MSQQDQRWAAGLLVLFSMLAAAIGLGYALGAWAGWIAFAAILFFLAKVTMWDPSKKKEETKSDPAKDGLG